MEQDTEKQREEIAREAITRGSAFFPKIDRFKNELATFVVTFKELYQNVVILMNEREHLRAEINKAEINLAKATEEAQIRLQNVERGHQAIVERLNKREIDLANKLKEVEQREAISTAKNRELESLRLEYERRVEAMATLERQKSKAEKEARDAEANWPKTKVAAAK